MTTKQIKLELPEPLCQQLTQVAKAAGLSLEEVVQQCVRAGLPPLLGKVPAEFHHKLLALNGLSDRDLLRVVEDQLPDTEPKTAQAHKADYALLRRTYALALLKWRGHPLPTPYEALLG